MRAARCKGQPFTRDHLPDGGGMEHLESERDYGARGRLDWLPEYRVWHTVLLILLTGVAGWYAVYRIILWLLE